ncbi:filamentous hemagglutinin [Paraburkholderia sp. GAS333]|uniref:hemagglutinin repeat-containing protein n=1 Tax=Paraburkholderia sp. GAS333 TaxID=3156279 RepID=UPI003D1DA54B
MNRNIFRLVFSRPRGMLVAVAETATGTGKSDSGETSSQHPARRISLFSMRHTAFAALMLFGAAPSLVDAQVTAAGAHAPTVIQTANGVTQVDINRPSGAGVSRNTYSQFDVPKAGVILNNSPTIVQTQQAGQINGNANLLPGQSARIILNQVNSNSPSQLRGFLEVAGSKAEVVVANSSGIVVDGGGFINTTRGILTTGSPILDASGNLSGFNVTSGNIAVQGAGLNATNVDQVDLIARAVQANAAIYANNLNVVTGANQVSHDTLAATPIAGTGAAPGVSIDVSQLGGMYANRIVLVGTENGVGVSNAGVIAAQAGDLTLTTQGKLVLTGKTNASGILVVSAHDGVDNSGTTYGQQGLSVSTAGDLENSGTLAAQQDLTITAGSVGSSGTLGAGINSDGSIAQAGDLGVSATGALSATGRNAAGGNATLQGGSVNLSGSTTSANGHLALNARGGDLNLSGATTTAGGTVNATASGALTNDNGALSSGIALTITAGALSNRSGQIVSGDTLTANVAGAVSNQGGTMQAAGALTAHAGSLDNTAGHIASLNAAGLAFSTAGLLNNGAAGTIGSNGSVTVQAGQIANSGSITAVQNLIATAVQTLVNGGTLAANGNVNASTGMTLSNSGTISAGQNATLSAATLDNSAGSLRADQLALSAANLVNHGGTITQTGKGATTIAVSGTLDNTNGSLQTNAANLTLSPATLVNDHGAIANSGNGTLSVNTGSLSNNGGTIATNGALAIDGGAVSNRGGTLAGQSSAVLKLASLDNSAGGYIGAQNVTVTDAGALDNTGGTIQANDALTAAAQSVANDGGTIANGGKSSMTVNASGALTNTGNGLIGGNGDVSVTGGSIDNSGGTLIAGGAASVLSGSTLGNRAGMIEGNGTVTASGQRAIDNTGGQIGANGAASTLAVAGASLDNTDGRIANIGNGATTVDAATVTNANAGGVSGAGTIGGNGDVTVNAHVLSNTDGAQIVSGHDLALNIAQSVDNTGGSLSGTNNLTLDQAGASVVNQNGSIHANGALGLNTATLDNTSGRIGNDAGSGGSVAITAGTLANQGGAIGSDQNLIVATNQLTGDGRIVAGNDAAVTLNSDYTLGAANLIQANHDLTFTTAGSFTNQGTLGAVNALTVNAANLDNQTGADLNSATTTVNAANAITNEGRIEGDNVTTNSATLTNTATIIGNTVTLNGSQSIVNTGTAAIMAAASQLHLYSPGDISNTGSANLFSLGDINIAADATRDAGGLLANRSNSVTNDQSTIEAQGNIEIATQTLTNSRPAPTIDTVTTDISSLHQTKRSKYIACTPGNGDGNAGCGDSVWSGPYKTPLTTTYAAPDVVSETSGANATDRALVVSVNGVQQTIWYNTATTNPDGSVTVTYWDGYDPHINYDPATEYPTRSDGHKGYQRVETARDTTTTTQQDQVTDQAQQGQFLAGGNLTLANVGALNNNYSAIAAGGSIRIGSTTQDSTLDTSASGSYGGTQVNNLGQTLYQYQRQDIVSTYAWNEDPTQDVGQVAEPSIVLSPVAIGGTGGTIIADNTVQISATDINNTNVAAANSATGATGGTLGANGAVGGISGGSAQTVNLATGQTQTIDAPQSVAGATGALKITLPTSGLYTYQAAPGASYLIVTDPRLTSYTSFISSDYMLRQLGLNPQSVEKRLGDGMYEEQLVRDQITQLTGRVYLQGYTNNLDEYQALMTNGVNVAQQFGLEPGIALTAAQMDALTSDIVWLVSQTVMLPDGTTQQVLAPVVYLAQTHANDLQPTGALISADDVEIHATGSAVNSGVIKGGTQTVVSATDILNRGGTIGSSSANGTTVVSATNDVVNASGTISGNRVAVLAGNNIVNTTLVDIVGVSGAAGDSKVSQTLLGAHGTIASTGDMVIAAGNDLMVHGANISAGGSAQITAGHDITVDAVQSTTSQSVTLNDQHHWEASGTTNQTSAISMGGDLAIQSGNDMTLRGAAVSAGGDLAAVAGGNLTATTVTDTAKYDNVATDDKTRKEVDHTYDEQAVGTTFTAGGNATLGATSTDASKGNVTLTGSSLTAGVTNGVDNGMGTATIAATGNVIISEAREEHDNYQAVQSKRGSLVSGSVTDTKQNSNANIGVASTVSGDTVIVQAGRDLTIQGSNVVGTNDVKIAAAGNVTITTSQDTQQSQSDYSKREYGFLGGLNPLNQFDGGLQGYTIGMRTTTDAQQATQITNNGSMVGSLNGNVTITAGNDLHVTGSTLHAASDLDLTGKTVTVDAAQNTTTQNEQQSFKQTAISAGISNAVLAVVETANQMRKDAKQTKGDARLDALAAATTGLAGKNAYDAVMSNPTAVGGVGINVSLGTSHSNSNSVASSSTAVGSTVSAGNNLTIKAAGAGAASNIDVTGSNLTAGNNAMLNAEGNINLQAAQNTDSQQSTNSGSSASIGVTFGIGSQNGISFQAGVSGTKGDGNGSDTTWTNTQVNAGNTLTLQSGGDTNLKGAVANGEQVVANVGGNLNIESLQDTSTYGSKQQSGGVSVSVCVPPICYGGSSVSGNYSQQKLNSNYASVTEQSGISAGDGGFQIDVKGNTDLKGAVISSSDTAVQNGVNSLATATLTHSDIENRAEYSGQSVGISGGYGGDIGKSPSGAATNVNPIPGTTLPTSGGLSMAPPIVMSASGDASGTTKSAISGGTITITDGAKQQQLTGQTADEAVAGVSRDTSDTPGTIAPIFDKEKIEAGFDITSQFVNQVGTFVNNRAKEAEAAKAAANDPTLTPEQRAAAQVQADQLTAEWGPGGSYRQMLTALTVAAGGNVTGSVGQFAQSATVAYIQQLGAAEVKQIADSLDQDSTAAGETARAALHAIVGCSGAAGSRQSCGAGALGASASSVLGSLLAPTTDMSAEDRQARENLVTSLVAGIATASGTNAATATGAGQIEGENNQFSVVAPSTALLPGWLEALGKLPGFKGETASKGDGVIADPATELDPTIKAGMPMTTPSGSGVIDDIFKMPPVVGVAKGLVDYVTTSTGGNSNDVRLTNPGKADSPVWQDLRNAGNGVKTDGKLLYEWDYTHNDIEVYDKRGRHLGSADPITGELYKPAVPGRTLNR